MKSIKYTVIFIVIQIVFVMNTIAQNNMMSYLHTNCFTAVNGCEEITIQQSRNPQDTSLIPPPQFIQFYKSDSSSPSITTPMKGNFTVYGPFSNRSRRPNICDLIAVGGFQRLSGDIQTMNLSVLEEGIYFIQLNFSLFVLNELDLHVLDFTFRPDNPSNVSNPCDFPPNYCEDCVKKFSPPPGKYMLSAWAKGNPNQINDLAYSDPKISIGFNSSPMMTFTPSGKIIDGWQRIDAIIDVPSGASITIRLSCDVGDCYFDDIRFKPVDASMITYVYDPITMRLMAQLDERNYATLYEYDEEGKLIRTKKETEKGIMTIQENRDNILKR